MQLFKDFSAGFLFMLLVVFATVASPVQADDVLAGWLGGAVAEADGDRVLIQHPQHGWLFAYPAGDGAVYYFDLGLKAWVWSAADLYPYVYVLNAVPDSMGFWYRYASGSVNPREFEDLSTGRIRRVGAGTGDAVQIELMKAFTVSAEARISMYLRLTDSEGEPVHPPEESLIFITESGSQLDPRESLRQITRDPEVRKYSLLLIDLSGSVMATPTLFNQLTGAAELYLRAAMQDPDHYVAVRWFAGTVSGQGDFSNHLGTVMQSLQALWNVVPNDRSTNLHGAFYEGHNALATLDESNEFATLRNLVVLTDGREETGHISTEAVEALIEEQALSDNGTSFYAIGIGAGTDVPALQAFGSDGSFFPQSNNELEPVFRAITESVEARGRGIVLVEYETTRRAGQVNGQVRVQSPVAVLDVPYTYSANQFTSPGIRIRPLPEESMFLRDSGIPLHYGAGKLYERLDHRIVATGSGGWSSDADRGRRIREFTDEYPYLGVLTAERPDRQQYPVVVEIRDEHGRILKRSEPVSYYQMIAQSYDSRDTLGRHEVPGQISDTGRAIWYELHGKTTEYDRTTLLTRQLPFSIHATVRDRGANHFFMISAESLVEDDTNGSDDIYLWSRADGRFTRLTDMPGGSGSTSSLRILNTTDDGSRLYFVSSIDPAAGQAIAVQCFALTVATGEAEVLELSLPDKDSILRISDDGNRALYRFPFTSSPRPAAAPAGFEICLYDIAAAAWSGVSRYQTQHSLYSIGMSPDGQRVFASGSMQDSDLYSNVYTYQYTFVSAFSNGFWQPLRSELTRGIPMHAHVSRDLRRMFYLTHRVENVWSTPMEINGGDILPPWTGVITPGLSLWSGFQLNGADDDARFISAWTRYKYRGSVDYASQSQGPYQIWVMDTTAGF